MKEGEGVGEGPTIGLDWLVAVDTIGWWPIINKEDGEPGANWKGRSDIVL
jgi:hypothetical protein